MKKYILFFSIVFCPIIYAQIGINTANPQALFHVDGYGNTSGLNNTGDDVVINNAGNMGVGTITPSAKLHIATSTGVPALKLNKSHASSNMLQSDHIGNATWVKQPVAIGDIYGVRSRQDYKYNDFTLLFALQITAPGNYLVIVRWWGIASAVETKGTTVAHLYLTEDSNGGHLSYGTEQDRTTQAVVTTANAPFTFTTSFVGTIGTANNFLKIFIRPSAPTNVIWKVGTVSTTSAYYNPSFIILRIS